MTKQTQHTPGPWATDIETAIQILDAEGDKAIEIASVYVASGPAKGSEICALRHDPYDGLDLHDEEYQANARLIAAAPELLAALEQIARACCEDQMVGDKCICHSCIARAAIAKAKGEK